VVFSLKLQKFGISSRSIGFSQIAGAFSNASKVLSQIAGTLSNGRKSSRTVQGHLRTLRKCPRRLQGHFRTVESRLADCRDVLERLKVALRSAGRCPMLCRAPITTRRHPRSVRAPVPAPVRRPCGALPRTRRTCSVRLCRTHPVSPVLFQASARCGLPRSPGGTPR